MVGAADSKNQKSTAVEYDPLADIIAKMEQALQEADKQLSQLQAQLPFLQFYPRPVYLNIEKSYLVRRLHWAARTGGFVGIILYGGEGSGKTATALRLLFNVYGSWSKALSMLFFRWQDLREVLDRASDLGYRIPAVLWDDMGVYGSKNLWFYDMDTALDINASIELIRTSVAGFIGTTVSPDNVLKALRGRPNWIVCELTRTGQFTSYMRCYYYKVLPSGTVKTRKLRDEQGDYVEGDVKIKLPDNVYLAYWQARRKWKQQFQQYMKQRQARKTAKAKP